jgi:DNA-binding MarR family transcriptional regulator
MADQPGRERRRKVAALTNALRDLRIELAVLNHRVGVHLATMTGILNRLEEGGWITRDRSASDRRAVVVASVPARQRQLFEAFAPMNTRMGGIWDGYADDELDLIADFLTRTVAAGRASADEIG